MHVSDETCRSLMGLRWGMSVSDEACWSLMGLPWGMLVSDGSLLRHVVSNEACWSLIRHVVLRWGMSVSYGSLIGLLWVWVSDIYNILWTLPIHFLFIMYDGISDRLADISNLSKRFFPSRFVLRLSRGVRSPSRGPGAGRGRCALVCGNLRYAHNKL